MSSGREENFLTAEGQLSPETVCIRPKMAHFNISFIGAALLPSAKAEWSTINNMVEKHPIFHKSQIISVMRPALIRAAWFVEARAARQRRGSNVEKA
jgi:hypothetical protein